MSSRKEVSSLSVAIAGNGGAGVMTAGNMLLDAAAHAGWYAYMSRTSGPQIRGGEAAALLRVATQAAECQSETFDVLVAVDWQNVDRFVTEMPLRPDSLIVSDPSSGEVPAAIAATGARVVELPMKDLAKQVPGGRQNMIALGAIAEMFGLPLASIEETLSRSLKKKGPEAAAASLAAVQLGAQHAAAFDFPSRLAAPSAKSAQPRWSITGNQAAGLGAIRGGVRFAAAYPITPATEVLEWLAPALTKVGGTLVQAEDELASINMIIGASFGGTPSITATSGPGLSLMIEALGLAVASETPIVVLDVMRCGPSTGIATKSEQSDLNIAMYGLHGDAPHLVLAPTSIGDCLFTTQWAVYLAEALQCPAIVLSDQSMGQARAVIDRPADVAFIGRRETVESVNPEVGYKRYAITASGVSPQTLPGTPNGQFTADGLEHTEVGTPSSQAKDHQAQLDKRQRKLATFNYGNHWAVIEGDEDAEEAIVTWGSLTGPAREAMARVRASGRKVRLVAPRLLSPAQPELMSKALKGVKRILCVEQNHTGQFSRYLRAEHDLPCPVEVLKRPGPLPIRPSEIHDALVSRS